MRQAKIVDALEAEKEKLSRDLEEMQKRRALRENRTAKTGTHGGSLSVCLFMENGQSWWAARLSQIGNCGVTCYKIRCTFYIPSREFG